jgi:trimethylamine:corrinoid methyltransferase-like protein
MAEWLHDDARWLLENVGFQCGNKAVADIFARSGRAMWGPDGRVRVMPDLVDWAVGAAPKFHEFYRQFGVDKHSFGCGGTAPMVFDRGEARSPTDDDVVYIMRGLEAFGVPFAFRGCGPRHTAEVDVNQIRLMRDNYSGVIYVYVQSIEGVNAVHDEFGVDNRIVVSHSTFYSPLKLNDSAFNVAVHVNAAKLGLPAFLTVMPISFSSGPGSVYGTALQAHAECLCSLVLTQLVNPGTMTVMAAFPLYGDPSLDYNISFGSVSHQMVNLLVAAVYDWLGLPSNQDGCSAGHYPGDFNYDDVQRAMRIWNGQRAWHQVRHVFGFLEGQNLWDHGQFHRDLALLRRVLHHDEKEAIPAFERDPGYYHRRGDGTTVHVDVRDVIAEVCLSGLDNYRNHQHSLHNAAPVI